MAARGYTTGPGTYLRQGYVYAATAGTLACLEHDDEDDDDRKSKILCVNGKSLASRQVLSVGQVVLCRVVRLQLQQAMVEIVAVEGWGELPYAHEAIIRREDIRKLTSHSSGVNASSSSSSSAMLDVTQAFRPGDLVVARVLSLGDTRRYFLSTAEPQLGVIHATNHQNGQVLMPVSWKEMECPETGKRQARKCARPQQVP